MIGESLDSPLLNRTAKIKLHSGDEVTGQIEKVFVGVTSLDELGLDYIKEIQINDHGVKYRIPEEEIAKLLTKDDSSTTAPSDHAPLSRFRIQ